MLKKQQIFWTVALALIWVAIIVLATLSPFAQLGGNANQFGDLGMWSAIAFALLLFLLPLYLYAKGNKGARTALAVIIAIFIIGAVALAGFTISYGLSLSMPLILIFALCVADIVISIIWYACSFNRANR